MKNQVFLKITAFIYSLIVLFIYSTSSTQAYFNVQQGVDAEIQAGSWWDKSHLVFEDFPVPEGLTSCGPVQLQFPFFNQGFTMIGPTSYRIYHDGAVTAEGTLGILQENQASALSFTADQPGSYMAEIDQRPGFGWNDEAVTSTGSKAFSVAECPPPPEEESEDEKIEEPEQEEQKPETQEPAEKDPSEPDAELDQKIPAEEQSSKPDDAKAKPAIEEGEER